MGSHQSKGVALVPDKKLDHFSKSKKNSVENNLAYHPGPAAPPGGDGSPFIRESIEELPTISSEWFFETKEFDFYLSSEISINQTKPLNLVFN